jgi:hypothetical protein
VITESELRAKTRALIDSGALPPMLPAFEHIAPGQPPRVTKMVVGTQAGEHCLVCEELGPQVSYTYPGGKIVRLHAACDAMWQQESAAR